MRLDRCPWWRLIAGVATVAATAEIPLGVVACQARDRSTVPAIDSIRWPEGTEAMAFGNAEGVILVQATVRGLARRQSGQPAASGGSLDAAPTRDTTGWFAVDTGAGFLALDSHLAFDLGLLDGPPGRSVEVAQRPLPRLTIGALAMDQVAPVIVFESRLLSRVTERTVLGLIGYRVLRDRIVWLDYRAGRLALIPGGPEVELEDAPAIAESRRLLNGTLSAAAIPARFRMAGDGKILLKGRVTPVRGGGATPWLNLLLDTGASKSTLFEDAVEPLAKTSGWRPVLRGLVAPTLFATSSAKLCRTARIEVRGGAGTAEARNVDVALIQNPLSIELERVAGEPVHGLIGYSFLKHFRIACDYPRRVLWLDAIPGYREAHPYEYVHVGLQLERESAHVKVVAVVEGSPAFQAGIVAGDELIAVNSRAVSNLGWSELGSRLEGLPGTEIVLTLRRGEHERTYHLRRRRLL